MPQLEHLPEPAEALLTVIIPVRVTGHYDMIGRLKYRFLDTKIPPSVNFLVIDEGSSEEDGIRLRAECNALGFRYFYAKSTKKRFCAAMARNIGVALAVTPFVMHEDIDLFPYPGFYQDVLEEIKLQDLSEQRSHFITVPAVYLSEAATKAAYSGNLSRNAILHDLLTKGPLTQTYLPASSVIITNRSYYLSIGGYNEKFDGWGLEDLEFAYRLTRSAKTFLPPSDHHILVEKGFASDSAYRGWRAQFRLHGELLSRKGICIFHAYHPKNPNWNNKELHQANKRLFHECVRKFDLEGHFLPSLRTIESDLKAIEKNSHILETAQTEPQNSQGKNMSYREKRLTSPGHLALGTPAGGSSHERNRIVDLDSPVYDIFRNWIVATQYSETTKHFHRTGHISGILIDARKLFKSGRYMEAAQAFDTISDLIPNKASYYREAAEAYYNAGQRHAAISRLEKARQLIPANRALTRRLRQMKTRWWPRFLQTPYKVK